MCSLLGENVLYYFIQVSIQMLTGDGVMTDRSARGGIYRARDDDSSLRGQTCPFKLFFAKILPAMRRRSGHHSEKRGLSMPKTSAYIDLCSKQLFVKYRT